MTTSGSELLGVTLFLDHINEQMLIFEQYLGKSFLHLDMSVKLQLHISHCNTDKTGYSSYIFKQSEWMIILRYLGRKEEGVKQQCSSAWLNIQTQKTFGSTVKGPPPFHSSSMLHESSLLHQQFPLCWNLKGTSEHTEPSNCIRLHWSFCCSQTHRQPTQAMQWGK